MKGPATRPTGFVSVCVPTYNAAATIGPTLTSLLAQSYDNFEIVISDNASTDATLSIVRELADSRVRIESMSRNVGAEANFARCIELARGVYTAIYHADDLYEPDILAKEVAFLDSHPALLAVFSEATLIDGDGAIIGERRVPGRLVRSERDGGFAFLPLLRAILRHHNFLITPSAMVRTATYRSIRAFDASRYGSSADLDVWLQIAQLGHIGILREPLVSYRMSEAQGSTQLIRQRTDRADFFKVIDDYLERPAIAACLDADDLRNYRWLDQSDRVARALALVERNPRADVDGLLRSLRSEGDLAAAFARRPRILVCYLLAALLKMASGGASGDRARPALRALRRLAKI